MSEIKAKPFIKWAGGKRQLLSEIKMRMPCEYNRYIEPFVGGGSVCFELQPREAIINDINLALINAYKVIRDYPIELMRQIDEYDQGVVNKKKEYYYWLREQYNDKLMKCEYDIKLAAMLICINKHCFNGLYRVNGKGLFNVPYNNSISLSYSHDNIVAVSKQLKHIDISTGDFEVTCKRAKTGDFVFIDSPYAPLNPDSFDSYTKEGFDIESHKRLANVFKELDSKGCFCMLTNHNTKFINKLYSGYRQEVISVKRTINADALHRFGEEIIITNY